MALKRIESPMETSGELPFLNKMGKEDFLVVKGNSYFVREVGDYEKGFLILTSHFKSFIFANSRLHNFLSEALIYWVDTSEESYPLFAEVLDSKQITLAIDDEALTSRWTKDGSKYFQRQHPLAVNSSTTEISNPLLPPTKGVLSKSRRQKPTTVSAIGYPETIGH